MWKNKHVINVAAMAIWIGFVSVELGITASGAGTVHGTAPAPSEFEGRFELHKPIPVRIAAGTAEYPELVRIEWIRFETTYGNAWGVTARVGWSLATDARWQIKVELLDEKGRLLRHSRDRATVFTGKASKSEVKGMHYADLSLDAMQFQGRRNASRFRIWLEPLEKQFSTTDSAGLETHTLEVVVVDQESQAPITDAAVVVGTSYYLRDTYRQERTLCSTDSQGRCHVEFAGNGLLSININAQKQDFATILKSWSNRGSWPIDRAVLARLPQRHVLEMVRAGSVGGIVKDTEGNVIEAVEVRFSARLEEPSGMINIRRTIQTDTKGCWRVEGVPSVADQISIGLRHPEYGGDNGRSRRITGEALLNARALKHVETMEKGLTIKGKVLDEQGHPVPAATAMIASRSFNPMPTFTDESGVFQLACAADMSAYRPTPVLVVEAPGYAPARQTINLQPKPDALEFRLAPGRNITCRVVDTEGRPIIGARTVVGPLPEDSSYSLWLEDTDERGEFQVPNVPKNDIKLSILKSGYIALRDFVVGPSEDEIVVTMNRALRVQGMVTDAKSGKPIPNFEIAAVFTSGGRTRTSRPASFAEGTYELSFDEAQPETCQLQVSAIGYEPATSEDIRIDEGQRTIDFKLARSQSFDKTTAGRPREEVKPTGPRRITGVVRDEKGKLVSDAVVSTRPWLAEDTITNAEGLFTLKLRRTSASTMGAMSSRQETAYLVVRHKEHNLAAATQLDDNAETVEIKLIPGIILSGKVVDVEGKGIPGTEISLTFWVSDFGYPSRETAHIDSQGNYEITAVPSGHRYSVTANAEGYGQQDVRVHTAEAVDDRMELEPMVLAVADLSISGVVVDVEDKPVAGARIYAYGRGQPHRNTITDEMGRFLIENVCKGRIQIQANKSAPQRLHARIEAEGGATDLKIVVAELDAIGRRVTKQPPSLVGKSLPDFDGIKIDFSVEQAKGNMILAYFFDMNQRPSRNCIRELAKQAERLKQKGLTIVAVQALEIDENKLNEWVRENNISFPVGMIEGDAETTRFNWGVRSLPWLILTDREHIVRANGFAFSELDEKLKTINKERSR